MRIFSSCAVFIVVAFVLSLDAFAANLGISADSAVLIEAQTGQVVYEHNAYKQRSMASTTKIMTSLLALEAHMPSMQITVTDEMVAVEGTSMGLLAGDTVTLKDLVYGMLLASGNDAANTVAYVLGDSPEDFAKLMNERAAVIGMTQTNFVTASGLDSEEHYSTAYDMALLAREAMRNPEFRSICNARNKKLRYGNPPYLRTLTNHNRLLNIYEYAVGIKTGYTKKSGRCLVSAAEKDGVLLIAVTLNAPDDWNDHIKMYDYGFSRISSAEIDSNEIDVSLPVVGGKSTAVKLKFAEIPRAVLPESGAAVQREVYLKAFEYAPVSTGDVLGEAVYRVGDKEICRAAIVAAESVMCRTETKAKSEEPETKKGNFFTKFINKIKTFFLK